MVRSRLPGAVARGAPPPKRGARMRAWLVTLIATPLTLAGCEQLAREAGLFAILSE